MKYFLDTEFIENQYSLDLISIGIVAEDGREYYAINFECCWNNASDWVKDNVFNYLPKLDLILKNEIEGYDRDTQLDFYSLGYRTKKQIAKEVAEFMGAEEIVEQEDTSTLLVDEYYTEKIVRYKLKPTSQKPEIWAYYGAYDFVALCFLFKGMLNLPEGFPMYFKDLKQSIDELNITELPMINSGEHHALADAKWNKKLWEFLESKTN